MRKGWKSVVHGKTKIRHYIVSIGGCYGFLVQLSRSKVEESDLANGVKVTRVNDANDTILMQLVTSNDNTET